MALLKGSQLWKLRTTHGREKIFGDALVLWGEAIAYFEWCDRNPWKRSELVKYMGMSYEEEVSIGRPYTIDGLTVYLGVSGAYFRAAKANIKDKQERGKSTEADDAILDTINMIESVVRNQQIEGASVGVFNASLVARINGIADNINNNNTGETTVRVSVRDQQTADDLEELNDLL